MSGTENPKYHVMDLLMMIGSLKVIYGSAYTHYDFTTDFLDVHSMWRGNYHYTPESLGLDRLEVSASRDIVDAIDDAYNGYFEEY